MQNLRNFDVVIIGAGAAGLMAALTAGKRGRKVLLIDSSSKIGEKIRISGGGRCNFTNLYASENNYISENKHFVKSPLARYNQHDFIKLVEKYNIAYHEKTLGQLFCDKSSVQIIDMLISECKINYVEFALNTKVISINKSEKFLITTEDYSIICDSLIIATGGLSIPKLGASDFGYKIAKQFGHNIVKLRPALVPLRVEGELLNFCKSLSGISIDAKIYYEKVSFRENILFTHRGLSGPAILQISSYLNLQKLPQIEIDLLPDITLKDFLEENKYSKMLLNNFMRNWLPNRFVDNYFDSKRIVDFNSKEIAKIIDSVKEFKIDISGDEGYLKAEVTAGGIDTRELSSKTMESNKCKNLFFIGEVVDVTGWLGGFNFQWAWSSGFVAGSYV